MKSNLSFADVAHEAQGVTVVGSITQCSNARAGTRIKVLPLPRQCYLLCSSFFFFVISKLDTPFAFSVLLIPL